MTLEPPSARAFFNEYAVPAFDELSSLYLLREHKCRRFFTPLADVQQVDRRVQANTDHLLLFHDAARWLATERYEWEDSAEAFTTTLMCFLFNDLEWIQEAITHYLQNTEIAEAVASAMAWLPWSVSGEWVQRFLQSRELMHKWLALRVCSLSGRYPKTVVHQLLNRSDCRDHPQVYPALLALAGQMKDSELAATVVDAAGSDEAEIRCTALQSALLLQQLQILPRASEASLTSPKALSTLGAWVVRLCAAAAKDSYIGSVLQHSDMPTDLKIEVVGYMGDPRGIPWLVTQMENPQLTQAAGSAFHQITGIDLQRSDLVKEDEDSTTDTDSDEENEADADGELFYPQDESLPIPDPVRVARHWQQQAFANGKRFVFGMLADAGDLRFRQQLTTLSQSPVLGYRRLANRELSLLDPATPLNIHLPPTRDR